MCARASLSGNMRLKHRVKRSLREKMRLIVIVIISLCLVSHRCFEVMLRETQETRTTIQSKLMYLKYANALHPHPKSSPVKWTY